MTVTCCAQISHPTLSRSGFSIEIRQSVVAKGVVCMQKKKEEESAREKELSELFKVAISQPKVPLGMLIGFPLVLIFGSCANSSTPSFSFGEGGFLCKMLNCVLEQMLKIQCGLWYSVTGVDPKSIVCEFFRHGQCAKGFKCKFSHDLSVERKGEKIDIYSDQRDGDAGVFHQAMYINPYSKGNLRLLF